MLRKRRLTKCLCSNSLKEIASLAPLKCQLNGLLNCLSRFKASSYKITKVLRLGALIGTWNTRIVTKDVIGSFDEYLTNVNYSFSEGIDEENS